ncbi:MAG: T9SS type A sorting domain-containing protein, partial [Bacteroidales bacterium]|nr:T9SS type A sorting domain-containing protein [Bacteroidales bacterium]
GSGTYNYNDNSMCRWRIEPEGATSVTLNFVSFDVEETNDYVQITDHVTNTTIAKLSGNELPASITIPTSKVQIRFFSNGIVTGEGWVLNYTSSTTAVSENSVLFDLSIWPNPVSNNLVVRSSNLSKSNYNIELMNLSGQVLDKIQVGDASAANEVSFDVSTLPQGIYLIRVSDNESSTVRKFIKK